MQPERYQLEGAGTTVHIEPRVMQVLTYLEEHAGEVVTNRDNPPQKNTTMLRSCLVAMETMAMSIENEYGSDNYLLSGERISQFIKEIKERSSLDYR